MRFCRLSLPLLPCILLTDVVHYWMATICGLLQILFHFRTSENQVLVGLFCKKYPPHLNKSGESTFSSNSIIHIHPSLVLVTTRLWVQARSYLRIKKGLLKINYKDYLSISSCTMHDCNSKSLGLHLEDYNSKRLASRRLQRDYNSQGLGLRPGQSASHSNCRECCRE